MDVQYSNYNIRFALKCVQVTYAKMLNPHVAFVDSVNFATDSMLKGLKVSNLDQLLAAHSCHPQTQQESPHFFLFIV
jgi:hypothetical protein